MRELFGQDKNALKVPVRSFWTLYFQCRTTTEVFAQEQCRLRVSICGPLSTAQPASSLSILGSCCVCKRKCQEEIMRLHGTLEK